MRRRSERRRTTIRCKVRSINLCFGSFFPNITRLQPPRSASSTPNDLRLASKRSTVALASAPTGTRRTLIARPLCAATTIGSACSMPPTRAHDHCSALSRLKLSSTLASSTCTFGLLDLYGGMAKVFKLDIWDVDEFYLEREHFPTLTADLYTTISLTPSVRPRHAHQPPAAHRAPVLPRAPARSLARPQLAR